MYETEKRIGNIPRKRFLKKNPSLFLINMTKSPIDKKAKVEIPYRG